MFKATLFIYFAVLSFVCCEPPSNSYGTPLGAPISSYGTPNYNVNNNHNDHEEPKAYEFGYQVKDDYTGTDYNRKEASDGNQVRGEYRVALPDGRTQIVTYWADWQSGFHADVRYEGQAQYPDQYNTYNGPSTQYGAPNHGFNGGYNNNGGSGGYNNGGGYNGGGYNGGNYNNGGSATSSVNIRDYSSDSTSYNTGNGGGYQYNKPSFG